MNEVYKWHSTQFQFSFFVKQIFGTVETGYSYCLFAAEYVRKKRWKLIQNVCRAVEAGTADAALAAPIIVKYYWL